MWTCADDPDRFVVSIGADDHRMRWGKVVTLAQKVETELGALEGWVLREVNARGTRAFVYVVKDVIVGALFAEPTRWAYRTLADDQTDAEDRRVKTDASQRIPITLRREKSRSWVPRGLTRRSESPRRTTAETHCVAPRWPRARSWA